MRYKEQTFEEALNEYMNYPCEWNDAELSNSMKRCDIKKRTHPYGARVELRNNLKLAPQRYVCGFVFDEDANVLLIQKRRPKWQAGRWNGIGGKIEEGECPHDAMVREAIEEADIRVDWKYRGRLHGINTDGATFECYLYSAYTDVIDYTQMEDERLATWNISWLVENYDICIPNVPGLVFLLGNEHDTIVDIEYGK